MMKIWNNKVASRNVSDISPFSSFIRKLGDTEDSRSGLRPNLQRDHRVHLWRDRVRIPVVGGVRGGRNIFPLASFIQAYSLQDYSLSLFLKLLNDND